MANPNWIVGRIWKIVKDIDFLAVQAKIDFLNFFWPEYSKFSIYFRRINRQVPLKKINFSLYFGKNWRATSAQNPQPTYANTIKLIIFFYRIYSSIPSVQFIYIQDGVLQIIQHLRCGHCFPLVLLDSRWNFECRLFGFPKSHRHYNFPISRNFKHFF